MVKSAKSWELLSPYIQHLKNLNQSQFRKAGSLLSHHKVSNSLLFKVHFEKSNLILSPVAKKLKKVSLKNRQRGKKEIVL